MIPFRFINNRYKSFFTLQSLPDHHRSHMDVATVHKQGRRVTFYSPISSHSSSSSARFSVYTAHARRRTSTVIRSHASPRNWTALGLPTVIGTCDGIIPGIKAKSRTKVTQARDLSPTVFFRTQHSESQSMDCTCLPWILMSKVIRL
jgi:hypothetical protein